MWKEKAKSFYYASKSNIEDYRMLLGAVELCYFPTSNKRLKETKAYCHNIIKDSKLRKGTKIKALNLLNEVKCELWLRENTKCHSMYWQVYFRHLQYCFY